MENTSEEAKQRAKNYMSLKGALEPKQETLINKPMSKRCKLQKEFYKDFGDYKGKGKYNDTYVKWLESKLINLRNQKITLCKECTE